MGVKAIVATGEHGESEAVLRHIRRTYVTRDNLRRAIAKLVNATFQARDPDWWGSGTACASDSKKFGSWEYNLMTEWHQRYGGPGVMIYWHVERRSNTGAWTGMVTARPARSNRLTRSTRRVG